MARINLGRVRGDNGKNLEYKWDGTKLGVRIEGDASYEYVDLKPDITEQELSHIIQQIMLLLQGTLDSKADRSHTHNQSEVAGLDDKLKELEGKIGDGGGKNYDDDVRDLWTAVNGKAFTEHTHMPKSIYLNYQGDTLDEISAKHIDYDGWDNVDDKIKEIERKISNIDSPDLGHITSEIEYLKEAKADSLYVVGEIIKLEKMISDITTGSVTPISGGNVNNLMETGMYFLSDMYGDSGLPQGVYFAYMVVIVGKQSEELMQIIFDSDKESDTYIRFYFDHSWRKWTKLVNMSDLEGLGSGSSSSKVKPRITDSPDTNELYLQSQTRAEFELEVLRISDDVKQDDLRFTFTSEEDSYSEVTLKITSGKGRFHFTTTQTDGYYTYELRKPDGEKESSGWVSGNKSVTLNVKEGDEFRLNTSKSLILTVSKPDEVETTELCLNGALVSSGEGGSVDLSDVFAQIKKLDEGKANTLHDHSYGDIPGLRFDLKNLQSQIDELDTPSGSSTMTDEETKEDYKMIMKGGKPYLRKV